MSILGFQKVNSETRKKRKGTRCRREKRAGLRLFVCGRWCVHYSSAAACSLENSHVGSFDEQKVAAGDAGAISGDAGYPVFVLLAVVVRLRGSGVVVIAVYVGLAL